MRSPRSVGRTVGLLVLLQAACGLILPFLLLDVALGPPSSFLSVAAENPLQVRTAVLLSFAGGILTIGIAIAAWPVVREYSVASALWLLALCVFSFAMDALHNVTVSSMFSLSRDYLTAGGTSAGELESAGALAATLRRWAHDAQLVGFAGWITLFYVILWRFSLVPRALAALGLLGIALQFSGVTLPELVGYRSVPLLAIPMGPIHVGIAVWLMVKGFAIPSRQGPGTPSPAAG